MASPGPQHEPGPADDQPPLKESPAPATSAEQDASQNSALNERVNLLGRDLETMDRNVRATSEEVRNLTSTLKPFMDALSAQMAGMGGPPGPSGQPDAAEQVQNVRNVLGMVGIGSAASSVTGESVHMPDSQAQNRPRASASPQVGTPLDSTVPTGPVHQGDVLYRQVQEKLPMWDVCSRLSMSAELILIPLSLIGTLSHQREKLGRERLKIHLLVMIRLK